jgi:hypothetical protein
MRTFQIRFKYVLIVFVLREKVLGLLCGKKKSSLQAVFFIRFYSTIDFFYIGIPVFFLFIIHKNIKNYRGLVYFFVLTVWIHLSSPNATRDTNR